MSYCILLLESMTYLKTQETEWIVFITKFKIFTYFSSVLSPFPLKRNSFFLREFSIKIISYFLFLSSFFFYVAWDYDLGLFFTFFINLKCVDLYMFPVPLSPSVLFYYIWPPNLFSLNVRDMTFDNSISVRRSSQVKNYSRWEDRTCTDKTGVRWEENS